MPDSIKGSAEAYVGCLAGATMKDKYSGYMRKSGFQNVEIVSQSHYPIEAMADDVTARVVNNHPGIKQKDLQGVEDAVASIKVGSVKLLSAGEKNEIRNFRRWMSEVQTINRKRGGRRQRIEYSG